MSLKLHNRIFNLAFQLVILIFAIPMTSPVCAQPFPGPKEDLKEFHWLVRLSTDSFLINNLYDANPIPEQRKMALDNVKKSMTGKNQTKLNAFLSKSQGVKKSLDEIRYYICKRKPCPPLNPQDYDLIIRLFRDAEYRDTFFDTTKVRALLDQDANFDNDEKDDWADFAQYPTNKTLFEDVAKVLCDPSVWGPCPQ